MTGNELQSKRDKLVDHAIAIVNSFDRYARKNNNLMLSAGVSPTEWPSSSKGMANYLPDKLNRDYKVLNSIPETSMVDSQGPDDYAWMACFETICRKDWVETAAHGDGTKYGIARMQLYIETCIA